MAPCHNAPMPRHMPPHSVAALAREHGGDGRGRAGTGLPFRTRWGMEDGGTDENKKKREGRIEGHETQQQRGAKGDQTHATKLKRKSVASRRRENARRAPKLKRRAVGQPKKPTKKKGREVLHYDSPGPQRGRAGHGWSGRRQASGDGRGRAGTGGDGRGRTMGKRASRDKRAETGTGGDA